MVTFTALLNMFTARLKVWLESKLLISLSARREFSKSYTNEESCLYKVLVGKL